MLSTILQVSEEYYVELGTFLCCMRLGPTLQKMDVLRDYLCGNIEYTVECTTQGHLKQ